MKHTLKATAAIIGIAGVVILPALLLCSIGGASLINDNNEQP